MSRTALLLLMLMSIAGCANAGAPVKPPACPEGGDLVADEAARLRPLGLLALRDWIGRMQRHCEAIEEMRG